MKTPVIIPAFNEADQIGTVLQKLDNAAVEPFVVVNGELGARETMDAARDYTANVLHYEEQGKLPAIQLALRQLLHHDETFFQSPVLMLDADSSPVFPGAWHKTMTRAVEGEGTQVAAGLTGFRDGDFIDTTIRTARRYMLAHQAVPHESHEAVYGANMAMKLGDKAVLDEVLDFEHIWPGEDRYLARVLGGERGERFTQVTKLGSTVLASARFMPSMAYRLRNGAVAAGSAIDTHYKSRRADTATHYYDDRTRSLVAYNDIA